MAKTIDYEYVFPKCPVEDFTCPYFNAETKRCFMFRETNILPNDVNIGCNTFYYDYDVILGRRKNDLQEDE